MRDPGAVLRDLIVVLTSNPGHAPEVIADLSRLGVTLSFWPPERLNSPEPWARMSELLQEPVAVTCI